MKYLILLYFETIAKSILVKLLKINSKELITPQGKNTSVLICLRAARFHDYNDSLMGMMETGLHKGPVHFNYFPDFTLSLRDPHILDALTLNIQLNGSFTNMKDKVHNIALIYRVHYKCIKTNLNVQALHKSPKDETLLIQSSSNDTNINIPQMIEWKDVTLPDQWVTINENYTHNQKRSTSQDIQDIQQFTDGSVRIKFNRSLSSRHIPTYTKLKMKYLILLYLGKIVRLIKLPIVK